MEIIEIRNDSVDLDMTLDELIIFRNSLTDERMSGNYKKATKE